MGFGDNLMASGFARGARNRGKRIAFGDHRKIIWDHHSQFIFRNNPNIAPPGSERSRDVEWVPFYRGHRLYNKQAGDKWIWNYDFRPKRGEVFFDSVELSWASRLGKDFIVIEPNTPVQKTVAPNKQWPKDRYVRLAKHFKERGYRVIQFTYGGSLDYFEHVNAPSFRHALAALKNAKLYIGPEGGLHHGAAAVGIPAVVIFGGFIPPQVTGYDGHINLTGGAEACGSIRPCQHCTDAMARISSASVIEAAESFLK